MVLLYKSGCGALLVLFLFVQNAPYLGTTVAVNIDVESPIDISNYDMELIDSYFIQNSGQIENSDILFYSKDGNVYFTTTGIYYHFYKIQSVVDDNDYGFIDGQPMLHDGEFIEEGIVIKYSFIGSNPVIPKGEKEFPWHINYFFGNDPSEWRTDIDTFSQIIYENIWDGIDLIYYINGGNLKYDLIVKPKADSTRIMFEIEGSDSISLDENGDLLINVGGNILSDRGLKANYMDSTADQIDISYSILSSDRFQFNLRPYNENLSIRIDPFIFSTLVSGSRDEGARGLALDSDGNQVITGATLSTDYPTTVGAYSRVLTGSDRWECFITKMNGNGTGLIFSTYIGGSQWDYTRDIEIDANDNIYICGHTASIGFPTTSGAYDTTYTSGGSGYEAFVTKLNSAGSALIFSTFIGVGGDEDIEGIDVDESGNVYAIGTTTSTNFITTVGAYDRTFNGGDDLFLIKLDPAGKNLISSTLFGGSNSDDAIDIMVDNLDEVIAIGTTTSTNIPVTSGAFDQSHNGKKDIVLFRMNRTFGSLIESTYYGGSGDDSATGFDMDVDKNIYITGTSDSADIPISSTSYSSTNSGMTDVIIAIFTSTIDRILFSTYLGGSEKDISYDIDVDDNGYVFVCGGSYSLDFPRSQRTTYDKNRGKSDVFVTKLNQTLSDLNYSITFGGDFYDYATGICVDSQGYAFVTGETSGTNFTVTENVFCNTTKGRLDAFISKLNWDVIYPDSVPGDDRTEVEDIMVFFNGSMSSDNIGIARYMWSFMDGNSEIELSGINSSYIFAQPGIYNISLSVIDMAGNVDIDFFEITILDITPPIAKIRSNDSVDEDIQLFLNASLSDDNVGIENFAWTIIEKKTFTYFGMEINHTFSDPGIFEIILNTTDSEENFDIDRKNITVRDTTNPICEAGSDIEIDEGFIALFDGTNSTDNMMIANWTWSFKYADRQIELYGEKAMFRFNIPGNYTIRLDIFDPYNNHDNDSLNVTVNDITPPVILGISNITADEDTMVEVDASSSWDNIGIMNFSWSFRDEYGSRLIYGFIFQYTFAEPGVYLITVKAIDSEGNIVIKTFRVIIEDITKPVAQCGEDLIINEDMSIILDASGCSDNVGIINYTWVISNGTDEIRLFDIYNSTKMTQPGEYTVVLTIRDHANNTAFDSFNLTVLDITPPSLEFAQNLEFEFGSVVKFDFISCHDNVAIVNMTWELDNGTGKIYLYGLDQEYHFLSLGTFTLKLTVMDQAGNMAEALSTILIFDRTPPSVYAGPDMKVELGAIVNFVGNSSDNVGVINWTWTFFDGWSNITLYGNNVVHQFSTIGVYNITLVAMDRSGNSNSDILVVTVEGKNDISGPGKDTISLIDYWWVFIIIIILVVFIGVGVFIFSRKKKPSTVEINQEEIPPSEDQKETNTLEVNAPLTQGTIDTSPPTQMIQPDLVPNQNPINDSGEQSASSQDQISTT